MQFEIHYQVRQTDILLDCMLPGSYRIMNRPRGIIFKWQTEHRRIIYQCGDVFVGVFITDVRQFTFDLIILSNPTFIPSDSSGGHYGINGDATAT